jgi:hypothetical protein
MSIGGAAAAVAPPYALSSSNTSSNGLDSFSVFCTTMERMIYITDNNIGGYSSASF